MNQLDEHVRRVDSLLLDSLPSQLSILKKLSKYIKYPQRNLHSSLGLVLGEKGDMETQVKYLTAIETITMGF
jgi:hypothetical protein